MNLKQLLDTLQAAYEGSTQGTWGKGMTTHRTVSDGCGYNRYPIAEFHHAADADFCDVAHEVAPLVVARTTGLQIQLDALRKDSGALRAGLVCSKADNITPFTFAATPEAVKEYEDEGFHVIHLFARLPAECEPVGLNKTIRDSVDRLLAQAGYSEDSSVRHQLACMNFTTPRPSECEPVAIVGELYPQTRDEVIARGIAIGAYLYTTPQPCLKCKGKDQLIAEQNRLNRERQEWALKNNETIRELQTELTQDLQTTSDALGHADSNDRELIEEQLGTIKALNIALGGEDSTSTENLIDANEVDYNEEGLISLCRKLIAENVRLGDHVELQKAGWSADYDTITRAEAVIEKVYKFINSPISMDSCLQMNVAIKEYQEGKKS